MYTFSPRLHILTLCAPSTIQSHLTYTLSPCVHILTLCTYSHLVCPPSTIQSHLVYTFSPRIHILTSCALSTTQSHLVPTSSTHSHLAYIFSPRVLPSTQNNIFHLAWKNSQKSHAATPIPSIRYLLRATNKKCWLDFLTRFQYFSSEVVHIADK